MPEASSFSLIEARYVLTIGETDALITVVDARRYSRNSGTTSEESEIITLGSRARRALPTRCS